MFSEGSEAIALYKESMENENPFDAVILDLDYTRGNGRT